MILVDTGPIVAVVNDRDDHHQECKYLLERLPGPLLIPATVATEVCLMLERRRGTYAELAFLSDVRAGRYTLIESLSADLERISELVAKYDDLPLGTVDASVIALAERLNITTVVTIDRRDFGIVRPAHVPALTLLP
ncbi:MAG: type II toxin-antitoxin system VapC family toxin [Pseudonocardiaceae bacterium]